MASTPSLFEPGMTKYHTYGLIVPLLASIAPFAYHHFLPSFSDYHHLVRCFAYGIVTTALAYMLFKTPMFREERYVAHKAVLLGLLVSELTVFHSPPKIPSIVMITFFLFMYYMGVAADNAGDYGGDYNAPHPH